MKPVVIYLQKQNLIIGIILAIAVIYFLKKIKHHRKEPFLPLNIIRALCSKDYKPKEDETVKATRPVETSPQIPTRPRTVLEPTAYIPKTKEPLCKLGIDIEPPSQEVKGELSNIASVPEEDIKKMDEELKKVPEFENISNSPEKIEIIKQMIILKYLLEKTPPELTEEEIQHIAATILSNINTVDPQIASNAVAHYSNNETQPELNPFTNLNIPTPPELPLNKESVNTIIQAPIKELSDESVQKIGAILTKIKIFMPFDECYSILTRNIKK